MTNQTKLRTYTIRPTDNISFPIGTILSVKGYSRKLGFDMLLGKHKQKGISLARLTEALISYRLTENHSITKASDWINRPELLSEFSIKGFEQRTFFRVLEILGQNREEILFGIRNVLFEIFSFDHTNTNFDWTSIVLHGEKAPLGAYGYSRDHTFRADNQSWQCQ